YHLRCGWWAPYIPVQPWLSCWLWRRPTSPRKCPSRQPAHVITVLHLPIISVGRQAIKHVRLRLCLPACTVCTVCTACAACTTYLCISKKTIKGNTIPPLSSSRKPSVVQTLSPTLFRPGFRPFRLPSIQARPVHPLISRCQTLRRREL
ncbi:hypothetical protein B0I35DRAFT_459493, partial [Stachybotrys elegans]